MAAVTICSDFGAQENKVSHCFHCFPICHEVMGLDATIFVFCLFEGNPVGEITIRRGTDTAVHRPQRPAGSTHSSTRGLRPPEHEEELKSLLRVKAERGKAGLKPNIQKTKIMTSGPMSSWQIEEEKV